MAKAKVISIILHKRTKDLAERVERAQSGIAANARVISEMLCERTSSDCREWARSDYVVGGLLDAIELLSDYSREDIGDLKDFLDKNREQVA
jgi:hypothetical protein